MDVSLSKEEFQKIGYQLVDDIAEFIDSIGDMDVTRDETPASLKNVLGGNGMPENGGDPGEIMQKAKDLLFSHSTFNGHPKFLGYIIPSVAPIGALAEMLAASVNPNLGAHLLSPMASEIEHQTVQWLSEFIGLPKSYGGLLVSGGNMANFTAFLAARTTKAPNHIKQDGVQSSDRLTVYCCSTTHTWIEKATDLFGFGTKSIRWIPSASGNRMDLAELEKTIEQDIESECSPIMVVASAGDVSTGAVDDLKGISEICKKYNLWFHVDGAYGAPAAVLPDQASVFEGLDEADSIALDPHKWLYSPLEAGCTLVKDPQHLLDTFSTHPNYYNFSSTDGEPRHNYYEYGLQNSRGFRALKVWIMLQQAGLSGYREMIAKDIRLSKLMFELAVSDLSLEAITQNLSITTLRFIPVGISCTDAYLNRLNSLILNALQLSGKVFLSNAVVEHKFCLRACFMNFRTTEKDIREIIQLIKDEGAKQHEKLQDEDFLATGQN